MSEPFWEPSITFDLDDKPAWQPAEGDKITLMTSDGVTSLVVTEVKPPRKDGVQTFTVKSDDAP